MSDAHPAPPLGATCLGGNRCRFVVWAPKARQVEVHLLGSAQRNVEMEPRERGYFEAVVENVAPGAEYLYRLDGGNERPDPAARFQPHGVHKPSAVVDTGAFRWTDKNWRGLPLEQYIVYEIHTGCFTPEGTFDAAIAHLDELVKLGVTAIELMPVAQFPGGRNWGYDGVHPFAVQNTYGGPEALARLVDACHARGLAAILDVVYNHVGPEGNYLGEFGHYFTGRYQTPWGPAVNFDDTYSDEVRRFFIENALYWVRELHFDALRLDAVHAIVDNSAWPFLAELAEAVHAEAARLGRHIYVTPESDSNDPRLVLPADRGGYGLDAVWNDDFHHALHAQLTGERGGYYADFGGVEQIAKAYNEGFIQTGSYSRYRQRRHGRPSRDVEAHRFVVFSQNHDQVGNRAEGDRLTAQLDLPALRLAAAAVILAPNLPLLFMGEEYGERAPFQYFTSHGDRGLIENVRRGRREEFAAFGWKGQVPDPQEEQTFLRSKLDRGLRTQPQHAAIEALYRELLRLRKQIPALARLLKEDTQATVHGSTLLVLRGRGSERAAVVLHFGEEKQEAALPLPAGTWQKRLASADRRWAAEGTTGSPLPDALHSSGQVTLSLDGRAFAVFTLSAGPPPGPAS